VAGVALTLFLAVLVGGRGEDLLDPTPGLPVVVVWIPEQHAAYPMNEDVAAWWTVRAGALPLMSVTASTASAEPIDTSEPGWQRYSVIATDTLGRTVEVIVRYRVDYDAGLLSPAGGGAPWPPEEDVSGVPPAGEILITDANGDAVGTTGSTVTLIELRARGDEVLLIVWNVWPLGFDEEAGVHTYDVPIEAYGTGEFELWFGYSDGECYRARLLGSASAE